jgi:hypothetical protein
MRMKEITRMGWLGLALLLPSCEKDSFGLDTDSGVPIEFSMSSAGYDEGEEVRSSGSVKPETVVVPLGEGNLYLYATLREEPAEALRAEVGLKTNQKVMLAAYKSSTQQGSTLTYTYSGGQLTPDDGVPLKVEPDNSNYTFVAYSYYGDPTTPVSSVSGIDPGKDLVWGSKAQPVTTTESTQKVSIKMAHKFAQVRVKIDASTIATAITDIGTVQVLGGKTVNLTERTGTVSVPGTNADAVQEVGFPSSTSNVRTSNYCASWREVTEVLIGSITLTIGSVDKTFPTLYVPFSKTLEVGKSYTLEVDLKRIIFAWSNIYWDAGNDRLTFDESTNSTYQGVFFKWGSLVGISPTKGSSSPDVPNVVLYIPNTTTGTWDGTKTIGTSDWGDWMSIPYMTTGTGNRYSNVLYDNPDFGSYKGDICAYLTGKPGVPTGNWRMPNAAEFEAIMGYSEWINGSTSGLNEAGKGTITAGRLFYGVLFFPASGIRGGATLGGLYGVGNYGHYSTGSISSDNGVSALLFSNTNPIHTFELTGRKFELGFFVRCVKI